MYVKELLEKRCFGLNVIIGITISLLDLEREEDGMLKCSSVICGSMLSDF